MSASLDTLPLSDDARRSLSWDFLWRQTIGATADVVDDEVAGLLRAAVEVPVSDDLLRDIERAECHDGGALRRLRAHHVRDDARPKLTPAEVERFLLAVTTAGIRGPSRAAWELLVAAGLAPDDALAQLRAWRLASGLLPTGQMLSDEAMVAARGRGPAMAKLPSGREIAAADAQEVFDLIRGGRKIHAIKHLRELTGSGLREAVEDAEAMGQGDVVWGQHVVEPEAVAPYDARARMLLDHAILSLLTERPFHWAVLAAARVVEDFTHPTMAVGLTRRGELYLFYNAEFVRSLAPVARMAVLAHEVNHVLFGHLTPPLDAKTHRDAWVLACEATANEFVPWPLPGEPYTCASLSLPLRESTATRYKTLSARDDLPHVGGDFVLGALRRGATQHGDIESAIAGAPYDLLRDAAELVGDEIDRDTLDALRRAGGALPGSLEALLDPDGPSEMPWDALLRQRCEALRVRQSTLKWPSRRAPDRVGVVAGRRARRERPVVLVAVDTSASMSTRELSQVAVEVGALLARPLRVACVQCDTELRWEGWLSRGDALSRVVGRGGTDLRPPFAPEVLRRYDPSLVVYFTDGEGPAPEAAPPGVDVLWVLTGTSPVVPARWGHVACIRPREQRDRVRPPR